MLFSKKFQHFSKLYDSNLKNNNNWNGLILKGYTFHFNKKKNNVYFLHNKSHICILKQILCC